MWGRKLGYTVNKIRSSDHLVRGSQERRQWLEESGFRFAVRGGGIDQASNDEKWEHKVLPAMPEKEYEALKANLIEFMHSHIYPNEVAYHHQCKAQSGSNEWVHPPLLVELMKVAKTGLRGCLRLDADDIVRASLYPQELV